MAKTATEINNISVKTVASQVYSIQKIAIQKRRKNTSWQPIEKDPVCEASPGCMGSPATHSRAGSKKVQSQPNLKETLIPAKAEDVLELDELWSFVRFRKNKRWLWTVMCRRTRQIVAFAIGDRSAKTCRKLWKRIPKQYRRCHSLSDFWEAYQEVFPEETHRSVGKESGQVNHMERWNCTLRQRLARYVRKTLSFSKADYMHHLVTRWFIVDYNLTILTQSCT
jgi:IS1 family transposase